MKLTLGVCNLSMPLLIGGCTTKQALVDVNNLAPGDDPILTFQIPEDDRRLCQTACVAEYGTKSPVLLNDCMAYCDCVYKQGRPTFGRVLGCVLKRWKLAP